MEKVTNCSVRNKIWVEKKFRPHVCVPSGTQYKKHAISVPDGTLYEGGCRFSTHIQSLTGSIQLFNELIKTIK